MIIQQQETNKSSFDASSVRMIFFLVNVCRLIRSAYACVGVSCGVLPSIFRVRTWLRIASRQVGMVL